MRNEKLIAISKEGRDKGKQFLVVEMSATKAEKWAARALLALLKSGADLPDEAVQQGMAGLAAVGLKAFAGLPWDLAEPLLDEMVPSFRFVMDPNADSPLLKHRPLVEEDIQEITTRFELRKEWIDLHFGFLLAARPSGSTTKAATPQD